MPLSINQIPIPVPSSTDPANFSARGDAVFGAFPNFITQTNAVASEAAANRDSAEASKVAAAISETNAATYAANATTSANNASSSSVAPLWVSGTTYAINDKRVSPITGQVYRRKTAGAGTTDPSLDSTNWYAVLLDADTQYPSIKPTLNLDFANSGKLDPRITFTRASTATYYDGKTFAKAEENLLRHSQNFLTASWKFTGAIAAAPTISASGSTAPDGTTGSVASVSFPVVSSGWSFVYQESAASLVGLPVTGSIWVRVPTGTASIFLNIEDSSESPTAPGTAIVGSAISVTTTWQRISLSGTRTSGSGFAALIIGFDGRANAGQTNPSAFTLEIWGAQLEQRSSATAYTPTTSQPITKYQPVLKTASNNEPRFDYDPVTLEAKGLLIEESRTNLLIASEDINGWSKQGCSVQTNNCISPSGALTADTIVEDTGVGTRHGVYRSDFSFINGTMTVSAYLRPGLRSKLNYVVYDAVGFSAGSPILDIASGTPVGNGWYRVSWTFTPTSATGGWIEIWPADSSGNINYAGSGQAAFDLWGVQLEVGSFPTSYIPTTATAVTRQADNAVMTGTNFSSWYNQSEGTICVESQWGGEQPDAAVIAIEGASANRVRLRETPSSTEGLVQGTGVNFIASSASGSKRKSTFSLKNSDLALTVNGSTPVTNPGPSTLPIVTYLAIGSSPTDGTAFKWNGAIKRITYYPKRLPNYQLQILTK